MNKPIRCLEFFSGIGGLHYAVNIAGVSAEVVFAFDVNTIANTVYAHNFGKQPSTKTIDRLTAKELDKLNIDCWLLSPPCQPYTQGGKMQDIEDSRAQALLHLIDLLPQLAHPPTFLFLENVKNFEASQSRAKLVSQLDTMGYTIKECLLSPVQFGIPNHRLRYYLTARRRKNHNDRSEAQSYLESSKIYTHWPFEMDHDPQVSLPLLSSILEPEADKDDSFKVPSKYILRSHKFRFDIVLPSDRRTSCITKAYGSHHLLTSGSLVQTKRLDVTEYDWEDSSSLLELELRFLTPTEISRLHAFPMPSYSLKREPTEDDKYLPRLFSPPDCKPHLVFPDNVSLSQRYRLLGNSLNCWVVAELLRCILFVPDEESTSA